MAIWAERHSISFAGATFTTTKEMTTTAPRRIARLGVTVQVPGEYSAEQKQRLEAVAHACPVHQSLHESVTIDLRLEWGSEVVKS
jgi:putative redox protein